MGNSVTCQIQLDHERDDPGKIGLLLCVFCGPACRRRHRVNLRSVDVVVVVVVVVVVAVE